MLCINIINKSFRLNDLLHKFREGLPFKFSSFGAIVDHTRIKIHLYLIPLINALAVRAIPFFWAVSATSFPVEYIITLGWL